MEMFSTQLERVGFKLWESPWALLKREGFSEDIKELTAREIAEIEKIEAKLTTHERERFDQLFEQFMNQPDSPTWIAYSSVLDIGGPEMFDLSEGDRAIVWHWSMKKEPTVLDGALHFDSFKDPMDYDPERKIGGIANHSFIKKSYFEALAAENADWAATVYLPHVRQLCADLNATLLEEEAALERIRDQLTEEIIRVRERRAEQEKQLKLEVEQ